MPPIQCPNRLHHYFFRKILNLTAWRILIRKRELIQFIDKPDPKTIHHNDNIYNYTYNYGRSDWDIDRHSALVSWIGANTTTPLKLPKLLGRIGSSTRASTELHPVGLGHRHEPQRNSAWSDWVIDTSIFSRPSPPAKLNNLQQKKQPGTTSHATMTPLAPLFGYC